MSAGANRFRVVNPPDADHGEATIEAAERAERAVLGALIVDPDSVDMVCNHIGPEDFGITEHAHLFGIIRELFYAHTPPTITAIQNRDPQINLLLLADLQAGAGADDVAWVEHHARIVAENSRKRRIADLAQRVSIAATLGKHDDARRLNAELAELLEEREAQPLTRLVWDRFEDIEEEEIRWLWRDWMAAGKLHLLAGVQGDGKSTAAAAIAAVLSARGFLPDGARLDRPLRVGFLISEDGIGDTVKPRLRLHGADMANVFALKSVCDENGDERPVNLSTDRALIEAFVNQHELDILIADALSDFLGSAKRNDEGEIRGVITPLAQMAGRTGCAVIGIVHLGKPGASARRAVERVLGSGAFTQVARIVWAVSVDPEDETRRLLGVIKSNLSPEPVSIAWHRERDEPVTWEGPAEHSVKQVMSGIAEKTTKTDQAREFLEEFLKGGGKPSHEVLNAGRASGIGKNAIYAASEELGISKQKENLAQGRGLWIWRLPHTQSEILGRMGTMETSERMGTMDQGRGSDTSQSGILPKLADLPNDSDLPGFPQGDDEVKI